ncbi:hypothetical protein HPB48_002059 [Haemaphysalis longicornis]|uniref:Uncharacterized protein n=1 Tax=Haemaphysalis longicornis TaxID=44386 RepID=A0A9J6FIB6_HAELO|nr:hypothetical protein HPB48_002059 [Haemaphysalis longicornis]
MFGQSMPGGPPADPFYSSPFSSYFRRHTPYFGQPDYRIYEMNKRLQQRTEESDNLWWDAFATEFFEDDATLTLTFCLEDGPKRYTIGRTLIPRYFRSIFEGGVTDLYFNLKHPKESFHNTTITLDCDQCTMVTHHGKSPYSKGLGGQYPADPLKEQLAKDNAVIVCTEGRLILEFTFDDLMRIKSWHFATRTHRELVPRSLIAIQAQQQDPGMLEQLSKNITRQGLTNSTLNYLRLCVILEPMQELMSRHKAYALSPRDCLKTTLFQKWQRMVAPPERKAGHDRRHFYTPAGQSLLELAQEQLGEQKVLRAIAPWDDIQVRVTKPVMRRHTKGDHTAQRTTLAERADFQDNAIFTDAAWDPDIFREAVAAVSGQQRDAQTFQYCQEQLVRSLELQATLYSLEKTECARSSPLSVRGKTFTVFTDSWDALKDLTKTPRGGT